MSEHHDATERYYVPEQSHWPIVGAVAVFLVILSSALMITGSSSGSWLFIPAFLLMAWMLFGWFGNVIDESRQGLYSAQLNRSFRIGMLWFIFSEVMFFAAFFGALFYARLLAIPWLDGQGDKASTAMLWPEFTAHWPLLSPPDPTQFSKPEGVIDAWKLPFLNTVLLVTSSITVTFSHHNLKKNNIQAASGWLLATLVLGFTFLCIQAYEYQHAYRDLGLTLNSGIYGSVFFLLTGFHGAHVTIGSILLLVMFIRMRRGHFDGDRNGDQHFAFEASSWYWHFVDVVWLLLFLFVYVI